MNTIAIALAGIICAQAFLNADPTNLAFPKVGCGGGNNFVKRRRFP